MIIGGKLIDNVKAEEVLDTEIFELLPTALSRQQQINDFFLEYALVHGNLYGTSKDFVETKIAEGINIILEIDVQGVQQIKSTNFPHESIFLLPPSIDSLTERLNERGTNSKESIELRLSNAMKEIPSCNNYDHILVNDVFEDCCNDLARIITGEDSFPMNSKKELFLTKLLNSQT